VKEAVDLRQKIKAMHMLPSERITALQNLAAAEAIVETFIVIASWFRRRPKASATQSLKTPLGAH